MDNGINESTHTYVGLLIEDRASAFVGKKRTANYFSLLITYKGNFWSTDNRFCSFWKAQKNSDDVPYDGGRNVGKIHDFNPETKNFHLNLYFKGDFQLLLKNFLCILRNGGNYEENIRNFI